MWGGMLTKPNPNVTEEEYYTRDYTKEEQEQGLHRSIFKWVSAPAVARAATDRCCC